MKQQLKGLFFACLLMGSITLDCHAQEKVSFFEKVKTYFGITTAPKKQLWTRWLVNDPTSSQTIDNHLYAKFLQKYVSKGPWDLNLVAYADVTRKDRKLLKQYLDMMSKVKIDRYNRKEQEAYWVNLYNALTLNLVLDHYPVKSILNIKDSHGTFNIFRAGPWDIKLIKVEGIPLSLNDIEHRILRPIWNDPKIHYIVNCASIGCPNLEKTPFVGKDMKERLIAAAKSYINSPRGVYIKNNKLFLSSIYLWYSEDFGGTTKNIMKHIKIYASPALASQLAKFNRISGYHYNWALNDLKFFQMTSKL